MNLRSVITSLFVGVFLVFLSLFSPHSAHAQVLCDWTGLPLACYTDYTSINNCPQGTIPDPDYSCSDYTTESLCNGAVIPCIVPAQDTNSPFCVPNDPESGINTALGCFRTSNINGFITDLVRWGVGISGTIALGFVAVAGIMYITSSGDPKKIKAAQEIIFSALTGIVLIALSIVILNFIGVNVLNLGSLGF